MGHAGRFDYFVVFAEMRTGSNFLEANLNAFEGISCHGEAFNQHFIGYPNETEILGVTQAMRDADPARLIAEIKAADGMRGFRYFHNHDPRVMDLVVEDERCAKIVLTRNPAESYISWKIAQETGQWKLTNVKSRKGAKASFDAGEFEAHLEALQGFQVSLLNRLQVSGQTAFYVAYEDLQDIGVMNGTARFLGVDEALGGLDKSLKRQNPSPLSDKVSNFEEMEQAVAKLDQFNLARTPNFEPRRGAAVPSYVAAAEAPLLYLPMRAGPEDAVFEWLAAVDGVGQDALLSKFNQKELRQWKRKNVGHRSFTVLRHPLARAHHAFCIHILATGPGSFSEIRRTMRKAHKLPIPEAMPDDNYDRRAHRLAFGAFLELIKANLAGQTNLRTDASWTTQSSILQGMGQFALPDFVLREDEMAAYLPSIAQQVGFPAAPEPGEAASDEPFVLSEIYDEELERLARDAYQRDYLMFGFGDWQSA